MDEMNVIDIPSKGLLTQSLQLHIGLRDRDSGTEFELLPEPFAKIGESDYSEFYWGCLSNDSGSVKLPVIVKIKTDIPPRGAGAAIQTNDLADLIFLQEYAAVKKLSQLPLPPNLQLLVPSATAQLNWIAPQFFCKRQKVYLNPPCPHCGGSVRVCRDEQWLALHKLPSYINSRQRFLYCAVCAKNKVDLEKMFYTALDEDVLNDKVGNRWDLVSGFGKLLQSASVTGVSAAQDFACAKCSHRNECYNELDQCSQANRLLVPFNFYDSYIFAYEGLPLKFSEYLDLLGGQTTAQLLQDLQQKYEFDRIHWLKEYGLPSQAYSGFLFVDEPSQKLNLEVLYAKITAFDQLFQHIKNTMMALRRGLYDLGPNNIWIGIKDHGYQVPLYFNGMIKLTGFDNALFAESPQSSQLNGLKVLLKGQNTAYQHTALSEDIGQTALYGPLKIIALSPLDQDSYIISAVLETQHNDVTPLTQNHQIFISLGRNIGFKRNINLDFYIESIQGQRLVLRSGAIQLAGAELSQMQSLTGLPSISVGFALKKNLGAECDFYSLGLLWLRCLLVNKTNSEAQVLARCREIAANLQRQMAGAKADMVLNQLLTMLNDVLFDQSQIFYDPAVRGQERGMISASQWQECLALGFRLMTDIQGFSLHVRGAGLESTALFAGLNSVGEALYRLLRKIKTALFEGADSEAEIREVLQTLLQDEAWIKDVSTTKPPHHREQPAAQGVGREEMEQTLVMNRTQVEKSLAEEAQRKSANTPTPKVRTEFGGPKEQAPRGVPPAKTQVPPQTLEDLDFEQTVMIKKNSTLGRQLSADIDKHALNAPLEEDFSYEDSFTGRSNTQALNETGEITLSKSKYPPPDSFEQTTKMKDPLEAFMDNMAQNQGQVYPATPGIAEVSLEDSTVIIRKTDKRTADINILPSSGPLDETIIIRPGDNKPGKGK